MNQRTLLGLLCGLGVLAGCGVPPPPPNASGLEGVYSGKSKSKSTTKSVNSSGSSGAATTTESSSESEGEQVPLTIRRGYGLTATVGGGFCDIPMVSQGPRLAQLEPITCKYTYDVDYGANSFKYLYDGEYEISDGVVMPNGLPGNILFTAKFKYTTAFKVEQGGTTSNSEDVSEQEYEYEGVRIAEE